MPEREGRVRAPFGRRAATITARERHGPYLVLRCLDAGGPRPAPGQFYMLAAATRWGGGEDERPFLPRAFSVLGAREWSAGAAVELSFLLEVVGPGTHRLGELEVGEDLLLVGPLGQGFTRPSDGRHAVLVGGGAGIAPLALWSDELSPPMTVLLGFRDRAHASGAALLPGAAVATDDGSVGHHGLVTELLEDALGRHPHCQLYACGPPAMLEAVRVIVAELDIPGQLALESGMACGYGACFGCVVSTRIGLVRLCVDGPVIDVGALHASSLGSAAYAELPGTAGR